MKFKNICWMCLFVLLGSFCNAETKKERKPEPYGIEEFAQWKKDLRRFEILSFGALPFVSLFSFWGYDMFRSAKNPGNPAYYPWPLKKPDIAVPLTEKEQKKVFFTAMGLSVGVAAIDYTARAIMRKVKEKRLKKEMEGSEATIELIPLEDYMITEDGSAIRDGF